MARSRPYLRSPFPCLAPSLSFPQDLVALLTGCEEDDINSVLFDALTRPDSPVDGLTILPRGAVFFASAAKEDKEMKERMSEGYGEEDFALF